MTRQQLSYLVAGSVLPDVPEIVTVGDHLTHVVDVAARAASRRHGAFLPRPGRYGLCSEVSVQDVCFAVSNASLHDLDMHATYDACIKAREHALHGH